MALQIKKLSPDSISIFKEIIESVINRLNQVSKNSEYKIEIPKKFLYDLLDKKKIYQADKFTIYFFKWYEDKVLYKVGNNYKNGGPISQEEEFTLYPLKNKKQTKFVTTQILESVVTFANKVKS
ncbi:MAG: hypothetical protein GF317_22810 [Candidatus Lokiarchaeota archaeon]|nr:hypothetical protein [Candidatus Lokiarchaeota archaeon]